MLRIPTIINDVDKMLLAISSQVGGSSSAGSVSHTSHTTPGATKSRRMTVSGSSPSAKDHTRRELMPAAANSNAATRMRRDATTAPGIAVKPVNGRRRAQKGLDVTHNSSSSGKARRSGVAAGVDGFAAAGIVGVKKSVNSSPAVAPLMGKPKKRTKVEIEEKRRRAMEMLARRRQAAAAVHVIRSPTTGGPARPNTNSFKF